MESVVAALLRDFESGKLTRRQLVQTLALMAVGSPVASAVAQSVATAPAEPAGTPWKTVWLDHISFQVSDYKKSVDFYTDLMGWKVLKDTGTQANIDINGIGGIIIRNRRRPPDAAGNAPGQQPTAQRQYRSPFFIPVRLQQPGRDGVRGGGPTGVRKQVQRQSLGEA